MRIKDTSNQEYKVQNQLTINGTALRYETVSQDWIVTDDNGNEEVTFFTYS